MQHWKRRTAPARSILAITAVLSILPALARAQTQPQFTRGSADGNTTAPGYDHPNQYLYTPTVSLADNMEPVIPHNDQENETRNALAALEKRTHKKPNILIFMMDDVGFGDPGFNGGGITYGQPTPNMDRLANEGLLLTSTYSTPSCSPTRATVHTGQNPLHHGLQRPPMYGEPGGLQGAVTVVQLLQKLGYVTEGVGKWHMGENTESLPQSVGYDHFYGFLSVSDEYTEWRDVYYSPSIALNKSRFNYLNSTTTFSHSTVDCTKGQSCKNVYELNLTSIKNADQDYANKSVAFIQRMQKDTHPFFLYHATRGCHFDNYPNDQYAGKSPASTNYADCIVEMDDILARLVKALADTGQLENTLIFLTSDNGPECEILPHAHSPFRGCKGSTWEGGVRVPTVAYWQGMIAPRKSDGIFYLGDLFNTSLSLAGAPGAQVSKLVAAARKGNTTPYYIDGIDQASFLVAKDGLSNRRSNIYTLNSLVSAVRIDEYKLDKYVELEEAIFPSGYQGGFSGAIVPTGGVTMSNLYESPKEDVNTGIRNTNISTTLGQEFQRYNAVLQKYPPKTTVGF